MSSSPIVSNIFPTSVVKFTNTRSPCSVCRFLHLFKKKLHIVALRPDFGSWPPLTRLRDHTQTQHTR